MLNQAFRIVPTAERRATVARYRQRQRQLKTQLDKQASALRHLAQTAADDAVDAVAMAAGSSVSGPRRSGGR
jgi:hypothetical protein